MNNVQGLKGWRAWTKLNPPEENQNKMRTLVWDPFQDLNTFSNRLNTLFGRSEQESGNNASERAQWAPLVDISETEKEYLIKAELPDVEKENVKVTVESGVLLISGERKFETEEKDRKHHRIE